MFGTLLFGSQTFGTMVTVAQLINASMIAAPAVLGASTFVLTGPSDSVVSSPNINTDVFLV